MTQHSGLALAMAILFGIIGAGIGSRYLPPLPLSLIAVQIVTFIIGVVMLLVLQ